MPHECVARAGRSVGVAGGGTGRYMGAMTFRAILALLALCLSLPAMAVPACASSTAAMAGMDHHAPDEQAAPHLCVGCVPVGDWLRERVAAPILPAVATRVERFDRFTPGRAAPPALPPPRQA